MRAVILSIILLMIAGATSAGAQKPGDVRFDPASGNYFVTVLNDDGTLTELRVVPPNKVSATVVGWVEKSSSRLSYLYTVHVETGSVQPLVFFEVDCPVSAVINMVHTEPTTEWSAFHVREGPRPHCWLSGRGVGLAAGGVLHVSVAVGHLPTPGVARLFGLTPGVRWPTSDPMDENEPARLVVDSLSGLTGGWKAVPTIVPGRDPSTVTNAGVGLGFLTGDLETSCGTLSWITDPAVCALLLSRLSDAQTAWGQGNVAGTRTAIDSFLATLATHHDSAGTGPVTDNAFWLLTVNAEFIRALLPTGGDPHTVPPAADTYLRSGS